MLHMYFKTKSLWWAGEPKYLLHPWTPIFTTPSKACAQVSISSISFHFTLIVSHIQQMDGKDALEMSQTTKAKLKIYGFGTGLLSVLLVGSIIANIMVYNYIYQQVDNVSYPPPHFLFAQ